jgi:hypothetical protein
MRGQISLDFMLAVAIGLVAAGALLAVSGQVSQGQAEAGTRQQLDGIGNGLAAVISYSAMLNDADSATVEYGIPALLIQGKAAPQGCTILIDYAGGTIELGYTLEDEEGGAGEEILVEKHFAAPAGMIVPASAECGKKIIITGS